MLEKLDKWLVDDWRWVVRKSASVKLAIVAPILLEGLWVVLSSAPPEMRVFIPLPLFVLMAVGAIVARLWKQGDGE
jgi:hypothetical protein